MDLQLQDQTALVTGSHRGTGMVIARTFLAEGADVLVHGLEPAQAQDAVKELGGGIPVHGDICSEQGSEVLFSQLDGHDISILVNNYGTAEGGSWDSADSADWIDLYQKNVLSAQRLIQHLLPGLMARGWGRIINLGTVGSTKPNARMPHYYAAKGALANLTIGLAKEVGASGVRVNLVSPGLILTPEVEAAYLEQGRRKGWGDTWEAVEPHIAKDIPIGRISRREEVADVVAFLASPRADAIHGQNIRIDGGALGIVS